MSFFLFLIQQKEKYDKFTGFYIPGVIDFARRKKFTLTAYISQLKCADACLYNYCSQHLFLQLYLHDFRLQYH